MSTRQDATLRSLAEVIGRPIDPIEFAAANSAEGCDWIAGLPALIHAVAAEWRLEFDDEVVHTGYHAIVIAARRKREQCVVKLTWPTDRAFEEARAMSAWDGDGAARLLEVDYGRGALLLERLDASRTLLDIPITEAASVAGRLLRRLSVPAPTELRKLTKLVRELPYSLGDRQEQFGGPIPSAWLDASLRLAHQLGTTTTDRYLVHADLHYGNVLAGMREPWLAIDPKPLAGDPEHAVPELLWTRASELDDAYDIRRLLEVIVASAELDAEMARSWCVVRSIDAWLWGIEHGLTEDPKQCERVIRALL